MKNKTKDKEDSSNKNKLKADVKKRKLPIKILYSVIILLIIITPLEFLSFLYIKYKRPEIEAIVKYLKNNEPLIKFQRSISVPYLNYIPSPNYESKGFKQHNAHAYRGPLVPQKRVDNSFRILFLGGSTTYGWGVDNPENTYPEFTGRYLKEQMPDKKIEIINAGLPWGTSAEILTHYLFKFRYYKPDFVVINEGGNDAEGITLPDYQPDYSNWRKTIATIPPVNKLTKILLSSHLFSVLAYHLFYAEFAQKDSFVHSGEFLYSKWYDSGSEYAMAHLEEYAFYRNIKSVVSEIKRDSSRILLLSFQGNPDFSEIMPEAKYYNFHESLLKRIAEEEEVSFLYFPKELIPSFAWVDDCHLNEKGEEIKGRYVGEFIFNNVFNITN